MTIERGGNVRFGTCSIGSNATSPAGRREHDADNGGVSEELLFLLPYQKGFIGTVRCIVFPTTVSIIVVQYTVPTAEK
jgi:hypothetical protein